ncbi:elongation factor G [Streptomyces montanisoli]|uniref:TetM/TetW/TetO/TetS family tetracycline resistance ribosomal protection protein n=1 Tax=Streptomyces montanisoli TaxID=2798581 RepID=A0A940RYK8_9ACTN|nr:TetM/TetW/TetO/TetS family tetracycline resistance ribosomal protection protein [Streptomyces montanisoli]MBP0461481.1 TetM/TetW/TetO/TetS family tetracycline resistance ribosomal protection protein [Streptomyces montanisoli]
MPTLNLGILAHIDAGKTSLTERLLHSAGVIDTVGSVDAGSTATDTLALERRRGITIKSAVVSFPVGTTTVNLIDTPGHPDFIAEVERVLSVLDGAVLVVSAVEGVQAQTRVLMRTLRRLRIPTLVFVNKIDRAGAQGAGERLPAELARRLGTSFVPLGRIAAAGGPGAAYEPYGPHDADHVAALAEHLADRDDALLAAYVADEASLTYGRLRRELAAQTARCLVHPVLFGSAITGAGVDALVTAVRTLLPAADGDPCGALSGTVFKVERGQGGERIAYARVARGTVRVRDRLRFGADGEGGEGREGKVTGLSVFDNGAAVPAGEVQAGRIGTLRGLADVQVGDALGPAGEAPVEARAGASGGFFPPPTLETLVVPDRDTDRAALHAALAELAEQDPLIGYRKGELRRGGAQDLYVCLYGEVQKEVVRETLADDYGIGVAFRETTVICRERLTGSGAAVEVKSRDGNPFLATVGLRVEPAPAGSGVAYRLGVELGSMPYAFMRAVEETVREALEQGLYGWRVTDLTVTLTHTGYNARQSHAHGTFDKSMSSTAGDFRNLTPLVLMDALRAAGTHVHVPVHRFSLDLPSDTYGAVLPLLARLGGVPDAPVVTGATTTVEGRVPAASVHALERRLVGPTRGEGLLETAFDHYAPVHGTPPARPRWDDDPLDRRAYLLRVVRRVRHGDAGA